MRLRPNNRLVELFGYGLIGGTAAIVDFGSFVAFIALFSFDYRLAILISFTLGTLVNFALCNNLLFNRESLSTLAAGARHYLSSIGGLATNEIVMIVLIDLVNFDHLLIARLFAIGCAFLVNFTLIKHFAFNDRIVLINAFLRKSASGKRTS